MAKTTKKEAEEEVTEVVVIDPGFRISRSHLAFIYFLISWPIIYLLCYVTRPNWIVSTQGYLINFSLGSGAVNNSENNSFSNSLLSDQGRENILWVSLLFALLVGLIAYLTLYYF